MGLEDIEEFKRFLTAMRREERSKRTEQTISKPKEASIMSRTRSATLPMSIIELRSLLHSTIVRRRFLPETSVIGPLISERECLVYLRTRDLMSVDFPT